MDTISSFPREVLVHIVKLSQKRGMKGDEGGWKEFLTTHDKQVGASISDPARRKPEVLLAFLNTFKDVEDQKYFASLLKSHSNRESLKQLVKSQDAESPEQRLVRLTLEHPQYPIDYSFPSHEEDWLVTKLGKKSKVAKSNTLLAVDCEMVLCEDGTEALIKICIVDRNLQVQIDEFVNPNKGVADYRTQITGVTAEDLEGIEYSLADIQKSLKKLLAHGTILVGHSLSNDLKALKVDHARVIDTAYVFNYGDKSSARRKPSLNDLCKSVLGYELRQEGAPHNCADDACAAMKLVVAKIEKGFNEVLPVVHDEVPESEMAKLFIHRIPKELLSTELHQYISGDFTVDVQASRKGRGDRYSAFAIFGSSQEAFDAYENVEGDEAKDSSNRPQKPISIKLKSGCRDKIYVRKMSYDTYRAQASSKRSYPELDSNDFKRSKKEQTNEASTEDSCLDPKKEIERLKEMVCQRDQEISSLHKIIAALTRKQGL